MTEAIASIQGNHKIYNFVVNGRGSISLSEEPCFKITLSQLRTVKFLAQNLTFPQISKLLDRKISFLRQQIKNALLSNGLHKRKDLIAKAKKLGLVEESNFQTIEQTRLSLREIYRNRKKVKKKV